MVYVHDVAVWGGVGWCVCGVVIGKECSRWIACVCRPILQWDELYIDTIGDVVFPNSAPKKLAKRLATACLKQ